MTALAKIHIAKKQLEMEEDDYRAMLRRVTGKASSKDLDARESELVLVEFERLGFKPALKAPRKAGKAGTAALSGQYAKKLQALWIAGWNLGLIFDKRDAALLAFVERQTGIQRTEFLREAAKAKGVIEALKKWLARDGGVDWSQAGKGEFAGRHGYQIAVAQWRVMHPAGTMPAFWSEATSICKRSLLTLKPSDAEWIEVMNVFGKRIRDTGSKRKAVA